MGIYLNPGNEGFRTTRNGTYVDKSGMISLLNDRIGRKDKLVCVSRPRRFYWKVCFDWDVLHEDVREVDGGADGLRVL